MLLTLALAQFAALDPRETGVRTGEVAGDSTGPVATLCAAISSAEHARRLPDRGELERIVVEWQPQVLSDGQDLIFRGRAAVVGPGGGEARPVDWPLPITVAAARACGVSRDWILPFSRPDAAWVTTFVRPDGTFQAAVPRTAVRRPIGAWGELEVAVALGELESDRAIWRTDDSILATSRALVSVAGAAAMTPEHQAIHALRDAHPDALDPLAMIRCAELLRSQGEERALDVLRTFLALAPRPDPFGPPADWFDPSNIDSASPRVVLPLVALLWDPHVEAAEASETPLLVACEELAAITGGVGPPSHVLVLDGLPLVLACFSLGLWDGPAPDLAQALAWAEQHGTWRTTPIVPRGATWRALEDAARDESLAAACDSIPSGDRVGTGSMGPMGPMGTMGPKSPRALVLAQAQLQVERLLASSLGRPALESERPLLMWTPHLATYAMTEGPAIPPVPGR